MPKQSLSQATKKSIYQSKVNQLDNLGSKPNEFDTELNVIESILGDFVDRVHDNINNEKGMVTTGRINDIEIKAENNEVNVYGNPWLIYQSRGVNGSVEKLYDTPHQYTDKMPPVDVFKTWIKEKNIRLRDNEKYYGKPSPFKELDEEKKINNAAWGMAKKVFKSGFKPRNIYSKEIPKLIEDLQEQIADFHVQQIIQEFDLINPSTNRVIIPK